MFSSVLSLKFLPVHPYTKCLPTIEDLLFVLGLCGSSREKEMAVHSGTLAWKIPWTEKPSRLQSMGLQSQTRLSDFTFTFYLSCSHFANIMPIKKRLTISAQIITKDPCWELQFEKALRTPWSSSPFSVGFIQILLCSIQRGKGTGKVVIEQEPR